MRKLRVSKDLHSKYKVTSRIVKNLEKLPEMKIVSGYWDDHFEVDIISAGDSPNPNDPSKARTHYRTKGVIGVGVSVIQDEKRIIFSQIVSNKPGMGSKMVNAVMSGVPKDWIIDVQDRSGAGFWTKMQSKHSTYNWNISQ